MSLMKLSATKFLVALMVTSGTAFAATMPAIEGNVFNSFTLNGIPDQQVLLYLDDGDASFGLSDSMVTSATTDNNGDYFFESLDSNGSYFVVHDGEVSSLQSPGKLGYTIDDFKVTQAVVATPISGPQANSIVGSGANILGGSRDLFIEVYEGSADGKLRSNPFQLNENLQFDMASGVTGMGIVTWDGVPGQDGMSPQHGMNMDFTNGGDYDGVGLRLAVDAAGLGQQLKLMIYSGEGNMSEAALEFPVVADVVPNSASFVPFSSFEGNADLTKVTAFQLMIDATVPSLDAQIDFIGLQGIPHVDFAVVPEPSTALLIISGLLSIVCLRRRYR